MPILIVTHNPRDWPLDVPGVQVVGARAYLTDPSFSEMRGAKVFNLARSYRYQTMGYYVSLLAEARGHRPLPSVSTVQDLKSPLIVRAASEDLSALIQKSLAPLVSTEFVLSVYFGRNPAQRYDRLSRELYNLFPAPLLRARFVRGAEGWALQNIVPIAANEIPEHHREFVIEAATRHFAGKQRHGRKRREARYDLAILHNPAEVLPPSDAGALRRFMRAAESLGMEPELITRDDYGRLGEFDALFIRETTAVNHHTYRFARRAEAQGLVVIDDPASIVRCSNKVYLAELMARHRIPAPRSVILSRSTLRGSLERLGLPCILKQPDSAFSQGVLKVETEQDYYREVERLLEKSDLIIAQEFVPTEFDWRVGICNRHVLYVCKYFMARRHWQIVKREDSGRLREGRTETFAVDDAPPSIVRTALKVANLVGDGLYGVDLKQLGKRAYVIEVNDNPSIEAGVEDAVLKDDLYRAIMQTILTRVEARKART